jgi:hypothetical protein
MRSLLASLLLAFPLLLTACPGSVETVSEPGFLERTSFELPTDGAANDNGPIGPFCCTGHTITVTTTDGYPAGYAYFYSWKGQAYNTGTGSIAPDVSIEIAGLADVHDPASKLVKSEVDFTAAEMEVGAQKTASAGQLAYTVTIETVTLVPESEGDPYFDMGSLAVRIDVAVAP